MNSSPPTLPGGVGLAADLPQRVRDLPQQRVSGQVAVAVVDRLEVVEIERDQGQVAAAQLRLGQLRADPFIAARGD